MGPLFLGYETWRVARYEKGYVFTGWRPPTRWAKKLDLQHHRFGLTRRYCSRLDQSPLLWIRVVTARTCRCGHIRLPASFLELRAPFFRLPACSAPTVRSRRGGSVAQLRAAAALPPFFFAGCTAYMPPLPESPSLTQPAPQRVLCPNRPFGRWADVGQRKNGRSGGQKLSAVLGAWAVPGGIPSGWGQFGAVKKWAGAIASRRVQRSARDGASSSFGQRPFFNGPELAPATWYAT